MDSTIDSDPSSSAVDPVFLNKLTELITFNHQQNYRGLIIVEGDFQQCQQAVIQICQWIEAIDAAIARTATEGTDAKREKASHSLLLHQPDSKTKLTHQHEKTSSAHNFLTDLELHTSLTITPFSRATLHNLLGSEANLIIYNSFYGVNPNLLAAVSGALKGGGVLLLLTPPLEQLSQFDDPEYHRMTDLSHEQQKDNPRFLSRLQQRLLDQFESLSNRSMMRVHAEQLINQSQVNQQDLRNSLSNLLDSQNNKNVNTDTNKNRFTTIGISSTLNRAEQKPLIAKLLHGSKQALNLKPPQLNPIQIITADRGRGKSATLGLMLHDILTGTSHFAGTTDDTNSNHPQPSPTQHAIIVTSSRKSMVSSLFKHLDPQAPNNHLSFHNDHVEVHYVAASTLSEHLDNRRSPRILIIDEAASLPFEKLIQWVDYCQTHRILLLLATTTDGYEGTGNSFQIRLFQYLNDQHYPWEQHMLNTPIRWAQHDPLERLLNSALLLKPRLALKESELIRDLISEIDITELTANDFNDGSLLESIHALLMLAHYRTTPSDFRQLLDAPNQQLFCAYMHHNDRRYLVGVVWVVHEGELDSELIHKIDTHQRRLKGHLLPQTMILNNKIDLSMFNPNWSAHEFAKKRYLRIIRIATHPTLQGRGIGTALLDAVEQSATHQQIDFLGTSFGKTERLVKFWQSNGYQPIHYGHKISTVTGTRSATLLKSVMAHLSSSQPNKSSRTNQEKPVRNRDFR